MHSVAAWHCARLGPNRRRAARFARQAGRLQPRRWLRTANEPGRSCNCSARARQHCYESIAPTDLCEPVLTRVWRCIRVRTGAIGEHARAFFSAKTRLASTLQCCILKTVGRIPGRRLRIQGLKLMETHFAQRDRGAGNFKTQKCAGAAPLARLSLSRAASDRSLMQLSPGSPRGLKPAARNAISRSAQAASPNHTPGAQRVTEYGLNVELRVQGACAIRGRTAARAG